MRVWLQRPKAGGPSAESSSFVSGYGSSYLNRLDAMRRHLAGLPTDREPPVAPW